MKKAIVLVLVSLLSITLVTAQADKKAKEILKGVSAKYRSYSVIKAEFTYSLENPSEKVNESQAGVVYLKSSANKFKIEMAGQEVTSDGKTTWSYSKQAKEVQVNDLDLSPDALNPAQIFTIYEKGFDYIFIEEKNVAGKLCQVIDLTPKDKSKDYYKVRLTIDKNAKQINSIKLFTKNGNRYEYSVKSFVGNPKVADSFFTFNAKAHPGVEVVDLR